jgi:hypothetical protein
MGFQYWIWNIDSANSTMFAPESTKSDVSTLASLGAVRYSDLTSKLSPVTVSIDAKVRASGEVRDPSTGIALEGVKFGDAFRSGKVKHIFGLTTWAECKRLELTGKSVFFTRMLKHVGNRMTRTFNYVMRSTYSCIGDDGILDEYSLMRIVEHSLNTPKVYALSAFDAFEGTDSGMGKFRIPILSSYYGHRG